MQVRVLYPSLWQPDHRCCGANRELDQVIHSAIIRIPVSEGLRRHIVVLDVKDVFSEPGLLVVPKVRVLCSSALTSSSFGIDQKVAAFLLWH